MFGLTKLLQRVRAAPPAVPAGHRVYAVGDVHGRDDLLGELLGQIHGDIATRDPRRNAIVFMGDLIDRGEGSAEVVERLMSYSHEGVTPIFLMGNHEEVLLRIIAGDHSLVSNWLRFGGAASVRSYGGDLVELERQPAPEAAATIAKLIPHAHIEFLHSFGDTFRIGSYLFVHAGIRPGVTLGDQARSDLRWIREPFLDHGGDHGFVVVHGHTITPKVDCHPNRIGLDTGAYSTGVLTAMGAEGETRWFLQTGQ
jgi:serine/threonine protein phosphatase 1